MRSRQTGTGLGQRPRPFKPSAWMWAALLLALLLPLSALAQDDCIACHKALAQDSGGHSDPATGCQACHTRTDGTSVPHKPTPAPAHGLKAAQPQLCLNCHDKPKYARTNAHSEPAKGCTGCHTVHASPEEKLLKADLPDLCYACHDEAGFKGKLRHKPFKKGACLDCHDAHSAQNWAMLLVPPQDVCDECHDDIKGLPHVVAGFSRKGHPLGDSKGGVVAQDPLRPGVRFYCGSCHDPHASRFPILMRFDVESPTGFCQRCHDK